MRRVLFAFIVGSTLVSCSLFTDLGGFTSNGSNDSPDGATIDKVPIVDAGTESGTHWCSLQSTTDFCEDFEQPDAGLAAFEPVTSNLGLVGVAAGHLSQYAAEIRVPPASNNGEQARLTRRWVGKLTKVSCSFDVIFDKAGPSGTSIAFLYLEGLEGGAAWSETVELTSNALVNGTNREYLPVDPPERTWVRFDLSVDFASGIGTASFDGLSPVTVSASSPFGVVEGLTLSIGVRYPAPGDDWIVRYDNVACRLTR